MAHKNSPEDPYNVTQASRIYFLPNAMTAGNLFCGFSAIIQCIKAYVNMRMVSNLDAPPITNIAIGHFQNAVWFILGAMAFDALDGRLARMGGRESLFGAEFDSIADIVSFGVAPALMVFFLILSPVQGYPEWFQRIGWFLSFVYLLCAAIRLARFNVITNPLLTRSVSQKDPNKDFLGLPVPAAAGTVATIVLLLLDLAEKNHELHRWALVLPVLMVLIAVLMISSVRYPSGKNIDMQTKMRLLPFVGLLVVVGIIYQFREFGLVVAAMAYISYGLVRHWRRKTSLKNTQPPIPIKL